MATVCIQVANIRIVRKVTQFWDENGRIESEKAIDEVETTSTDSVSQQQRLRAKTQASFFTTLLFVCRRQFKVSHKKNLFGQAFKCYCTYICTTEGQLQVSG